MVDRSGFSVEARYNRRVATSLVTKANDLRILPSMASALTFLGADSGEIAGMI